MKVAASTETTNDWKAVVDADPGHIFYDEFHDGIRVLVVRGPAALCAYLGLPKDHPLAGFSYDDIPLQVHGGLTYSGDGIKGAPDGHYWFGWDYSHAGDFSTYDEERQPEYKRDDHKWTAREVITEAKDAVWDFKKVAELAERITLKKAGFLMANKR